MSLASVHFPLSKYEVTPPPFDDDHAYCDSSGVLMTINTDAFVFISSSDLQG